VVKIRLKPFSYIVNMNYTKQNYHCNGKENFKIPEIVGLSIALYGFPCFCFPGDLQTLRQASSASSASYEMSAHRTQKSYTPGIFLRLVLDTSGDKIEKNEMGGTCRAYGERRGI
jgi:hypothetical protein